MSTIESGLSSRVRAAIAAAGLRFKGDGGDNNSVVETLDHDFYSVLAYANDGSSPNGDATFKFFQDKRSVHVTNIVKPGQLTVKSGVLVRGIGFEFLPSKSVNLASASAATNAAVVGDTQRILRQGYFRFDVNGDMKHENIGLHKYPAGGGVSVSGDVAATAATTAVANNGVPLASNRRIFDSPVLVTPDDDVSLTVEFASKIALTVGGMTGELIAYLWGREIRDP